MRKIILLLMATIMLLCTFGFVGCVKTNDENSYTISIYRENYSQKENGDVVFDGYELKDSFQVIKTQMFEIDYGIRDGAFSYGIEPERVYSGLESTKCDYTAVKQEKLQIFPYDNMRILVREREKKSISIFYNNQEISFQLKKETAEEYNNQFKNTYIESFQISSTCVDELFSNLKRDITLELYTNAAFSGEPFETKNLNYEDYYKGYSGGFSFYLIKTTNVYIKVI